MNTSPARPLKVVLTGPEASGKTSLAHQLAAHFRTVWLPEYARAYLGQSGHNYTYDDVVAIAQKQPELEAEYLQKAHNILFLDTDLIITKVWFDVVFDAAPANLEAMIGQNHGDLYLLTHPDLPWEYDPLREYSDWETRNKLFLTYKQELTQRGYPFAEIRGDGEARFEACLRALGHWHGLKKPLL